MAGEAVKRNYESRHQRAAEARRTPGRCRAFVYLTHRAKRPGVRQPPGACLSPVGRPSSLIDIAPQPS
jgi:hypothetical protein